MDMLDFYDLVQRARQEQQKVICFIRPESSTLYDLYVIRDVLDPEVNLNEYNFKEAKGVESIALDLTNDKQTDSIQSESIQHLVTSSVIDYDTNIKNIIDRLKVYLGYLNKTATPPHHEWDFLYLYSRSIETQRKVAKQLGVTIQQLYNYIFINEIKEPDKRVYFAKITPFKFNYVGMAYINIYTFDIYLQLYYRPDIDIFINGITRPISGNLLVAIFPADSSEQVISQFVNFQSDFTKVIFVQTRV